MAPNSDFACSAWLRAPRHHTGAQQRQIVRTTQIICQALRQFGVPGQLRGSKRFKNLQRMHQIFNLFAPFVQHMVVWSDASEPRSAPACVVDAPECRTQLAPAGMTHRPLLRAVAGLLQGTACRDQLWCGSAQLAAGLALRFAQVPGHCQKCSIGTQPGMALAQQLERLHQHPGVARRVQRSCHITQPRVLAPKACAAQCGAQQPNCRA
jgi:hypothetical protein